MAMRRFLLTGLALATLSAGPPFRTDDPQPVDLGHLELYGFAAGQHASGIGPALEFNYGILPDTQFHLVAPIAYARAPGLRAGPGDVEVGLKYRFLHETDTLPQIGVFPLVELPAGDAARGLGAGHTQVYLPVWLQKSRGPWTTYGGAGWWRNPGARNWTYAGWLLQRDFGEKLTLGAEAFRTTAQTEDGHAATGFTAGGQVNLSERHHLLFSAGRTNDGQTSFYVGYQLTAGPFGNLADGFRRARP